MQKIFDQKFRVHFIGIGGIGMSAIAVYLKNLCYTVSGSDVKKSFTTDELEKKGIPVFLGHNELNVKDKDIIIYSSAVGEGNVEYLYAKKNGLAMFSRAEILDLISRRYLKSVGVCGAHGKTTTTALIAHIFKAAEIPFTAFIGGYDKELTNECNFGDKVFLAEICEYKKNIDRFTMDNAVLLNIDNDHAECYKDIDDLINSFKSFFDRAKYRVINSDDPVLKNFAGEKTSVGIKSGDYFIKSSSEKNGKLYLKIAKKGGKDISVKVALSGEYNAYNVLAAIALSKQFDISDEAIKKGLCEFSGIARRDETIGKLSSALVVADYAHHPEEVSESIKRYLKRFEKKVCFIFQPHTYSRTKLLFGEFVNSLKDVKELYIFKTFPAREKYDAAGDAKRLSDALLNAEYYSDYSALINKIKKRAPYLKGIVVLGAGDLYDVIKKDIKKCGK